MEGVMPISYRIVGDFVVTTVEGASTLAEVLAYQAALRSDPGYRPGMPNLIDCRRVTALLSSDDLRAIAREARRHPNSGVRARTALLGRSDVVFGVLRMYEAFTEGSSAAARAFRNEAEALAWLHGSTAA
jgi:hypothetical protein